MLKTIIIGIIVTVVGLFVLSSVSNSVNNNTSSSLNGYTTKTSLDENTVSVAISGEINHPGSYYIATNETLGDLITLAGGTTSSADEKAYNVTLVIDTRTSFYIPPISTSNGVCVDEEEIKVNINTDDEDSLKTVGFSTTQATNLITYRNENGSFQAIEDILNVKGVGKATFEKVKNKIRIS